MKSDQIEKIKILVDEDEKTGLVSMDEYTIEDDTVDVPGYDRTVPVRNGVTKIPPIPAVYKIQRGSDTLKFFQDWYFKKEVHNVTVIRLDGAGNEIARELWPNTELGKCNSAGYDAAAPTFSKVMITFLPENIIPLAAEV